jgi:hypothetical protein
MAPPEELPENSRALAAPAHSMSHSTEIAKMSQPYSTLQSLIVFFQHCDGMNV